MRNGSNWGYSFSIAIIIIAMYIYLGETIHAEEDSNVSTGVVTKIAEEILIADHPNKNAIEDIVNEKTIVVL